MARMPVSGVAEAGALTHGRDANGGSRGGGVRDGGRRGEPAALRPMLPCAINCSRNCKSSWRWSPRSTAWVFGAGMPHRTASGPVRGPAAFWVLTSTSCSPATTSLPLFTRRMCRALLQAIGSTTRTGDLVQLELRVAGRGGEIRWITAKSAASRDAKGALARVTGCVIDDSQRREAEEELAKQQRQITHLTRVAMLGELSGALAHELQQPLTAILCNAQAAQMLTAKSSLDVVELREILQDIVTDNKHAGQIIHNLRALLMRGEMHFHRHEIADLLDGVSDPCARHTGRAQGRRRNAHRGRRSGDSRRSRGAATGIAEPRAQRQRIDESKRGG